LFYDFFMLPLGYDTTILISFKTNLESRAYSRKQSETHIWPEAKVLDAESRAGVIERFDAGMLL